MASSSQPEPEAMQYFWSVRSPSFPPQTPQTPVPESSSSGRLRITHVDGHLFIELRHTTPRYGRLTVILNTWSAFSIRAPHGTVDPAFLLKTRHGCYRFGHSSPTLGGPFHLHRVDHPRCAYQKTEFWLFSGYLCGDSASAVAKYR